jgi:hypothetical protein
VEYTCQPLSILPVKTISPSLEPLVVLSWEVNVTGLAIWATAIIATVTIVNNVAIFFIIYFGILVIV